MLVHLVSLLQQFTSPFYFTLKDRVSYHRHPSIFMYVRTIISLLLIPYTSALRKKSQNINNFVQEAETLVRGLLTVLFGPLNIRDACNERCKQVTISPPLLALTCKTVYSEVSNKQLCGQGGRTQSIKGQATTSPPQPQL